MLSVAHRPVNIFRKLGTDPITGLIRSAKSPNSPSRLSLSKNLHKSLKEEGIVARSCSNPNMSIFKFNDYDCIGFDLDNTILWYNITNMVQMEYKVMSDFLVSQKGYDPNYLQAPLTDESIDFMQKGLILDFQRGNILKASCDGLIRKATHGTRFLTLEEIQETYKNQRWEALDLLMQDPMAVWNGPWSLKIRALMDYFDLPISLLFARAVDSIDSKTPGERYDIWPDIFAAATDMFLRTNFREDRGSYFRNMKTNPDKYFRKCSQEIVDWLREVKKQKTTFLITGSNVDFAEFTASHVIGEDWKELFNVVVCFAKKPGFFVSQSPFWTVDDHQEIEVIGGEGLAENGLYSQGNWGELREFLGRLCGKTSPKCLYAGDNLLQDVFIPSRHAGLDTVVVSEELHAEGMVNISWPHPDEKYLVSKCWGSYFSGGEGNVGIDSHWSSVVERQSRICVPSLKIVAHHSIDHPFGAFDEAHDKTRGFHPAPPAGLPAEDVAN